MAKKEEKVSVSKIDDIIKEQYNGSVTGEVDVDWYGLTIKVKFPPTLSDTIQIADDVASGCFLDDDRYVPEIKEFLFRRAIVERCTNLRLPQNIEKQYELLMGTDLFDALGEVYDDDQLDAMMEPIDDKIDHMRDMQLATERARLNELIAQFKQIGENIESLFGGVTNDDLRGLIGAIGKSGVDEEKLMSQYLEQRYGKEKEEESSPNLTLIPKEE